MQKIIQEVKSLFIGSAGLILELAVVAVVRLKLLNLLVLAGWLQVVVFGSDVGGKSDGDVGRWLLGRCQW